MSIETFQIRAVGRQGNRVKIDIQYGEKIHRVFFEKEDLTQKLKNIIDLKINGFPNLRL